MTLSSTLDGGSTFTVDAGSGGDLLVTGAVGVSAPLTSITVSESTDVTFSNALNLSGALDTTGTGTTTLTGAASAGSFDVTATTGIVASNTLTATGGGNISLASDSINFSGSVSGTGTITLADYNNDAGISVDGGSAGDLVLSNAELALLQDGFSEIIIGNGTTGTITIGNGGNSFADNVHFKSGGTTGNVDLESTPTIASGNNLTFTLGSSASMVLDNDLQTDGGDITINGALTVDGARTIDTESGADGAGGNLIVTGAIDSTDVSGDSLSIDASGTSNGAVTLSSDVGGTNDLTGFTIAGGATQVDLADLGITGGNIAVTGDNIDLNGDSYVATTSGSITFTGAVDLDSTGSLTVQTAGADSDDITFTSTIDDTGSNTDLTINAGAEGDLTFGGSVGSSNSIGTITATTLDDVIISGDEITSAGAISITGDASDTVSLSGTSNTTTITSGGADTEDISISGLIDDAANDTTLSLNAGALGDVSLGAAVGSGNAIAGLTISNAYDATLQAVSTAGGAISVGTDSSTRLGGTLSLNGDLASENGGATAGAISLYADDILLEATGTGSISLDADAATTDAVITIATDAAGSLSSSTAWDGWHYD